jgi:hypothetical protein
MVLALFVFLALVIMDTFNRFPSVWLYIVLLDLHFQLSRVGLAAAAIMTAIGVYTGIIRKGDVTPIFRSATYVIVATMLMQAILGLVMIFQDGRPAQDVHYIYGAATVLVLPLFIFIEVTAKKRPAMGSYIWGFTLLLGIIVRSIMTG